MNKHVKGKTDRETYRKIQRGRRRKQRRCLLLLFLIFIAIASGGIFMLISISAFPSVPDRSASKEGDFFSKKSVLLDVAALCQNPELPTGCECCAAVMALRRIGVDTDLCAFASKIPCKKIDIDGEKYYGPDPEHIFAGSPFESLHSFGCFENVIIKAINDSYINVHAEKVTGTIDDLCTEYVNKGIPVLVWVTMDMREIEYKSHWTLPTGEKFFWPAGEHCMLLIGFDEDFYYFNDPLPGVMVSFDKSISEERYSEMGSRAVIIKEN